MSNNSRNRCQGKGRVAWLRVVGGAGSALVLAGCGGATVGTTNAERGHPQPSIRAVGSSPTSKTSQTPAEHRGGTSSIPPQGRSAASTSSTQSPIQTQGRSAASTDPTNPNGPTSPSNSRPCVASEMEAAFAGSVGAGGKGYYGFNLTNVGGVMCELTGYFGVSPIGTDGSQLTTSDDNQPRTNSGLPSQEIQLQPGATASVSVGVTEERATPSCPGIAQFDLSAPHNGGVLSVPMSDPSQHWYCGGPIDVYPTAPGSAN
jgi:hypothetical protein